MDLSNIVIIITVIIAIVNLINAWFSLRVRTEINCMKIQMLELESNILNRLDGVYIRSDLARAEFSIRDERINNICHQVETFRDRCEKRHTT